MTGPDVASIADGLSEAQRRCGDVLDNLPCDHCRATSLRGCIVAMDDRRAATDLINRTPGLMNYLRAHILRSERDA